MNGQRFAALLKGYAWPGNIGELRNCIERAIVLAAGDELTSDLLPPALLGRKRGQAARHGVADMETLTTELVQQGLATTGAEDGDLQSRIVNPVERELIVQVLADCKNVQTKAAARLGINRNTLHKKLKEYGLEGGETAE